MNIDTDILEREISDDIEIRTKELNLLTQICTNSNLDDTQKELILRFSISIVYSIWEGFVKNSIRKYINSINSLNLNFAQINQTILIHYLDSKYPQFTTGLKDDFVEKHTFFDKVNQGLSRICIVEKLPTKSNINFDVLNDILYRLNLDKLSEDFKEDLNELLKYRNKVAHGDVYSNAIDIELLTKIITNVINVMNEVLLIIRKGCDDNTYLKY